MRIACVADEPIPSLDTLTVQVVQTLSALVRAGARATLFLPLQDEPDPEALRQKLIERYKTTCGFDIELFRIPAGPRWIEKPAMALRALRSSTDKKYDLLYSRIALPVFPALVKRRPVLFETYRPLTRQYPPTKALFAAVRRSRNFLGLVTHSNYTRDCFVADGMPPEQVRTIYNGYDASAFATTPTPQQARKAMGLPEKPTIVYAGRIAPLKRIDLLLDAVERCPDAQLIMAGDTSTEEARPFAERARRMGAHLPGYVSGADFAQVLHAGDVLVIPPSMAPLKRFGNTVLPIKVFQYLAAGRPIVTGDTPDTAEILKDGESSLRVAPDNLDALVQAIRTVLDDAALQRSLGAAGRERSLDLTWDARAGRLLEFMSERLAAR